MKFISSSYNPKTGKSEVIMQHLGVKFKGTAQIHPDDKENASNFAGCYLAELRAKILALRYERYLAKKKSDDAIDFMKSCKNYANFDPESPTAKAMFRQINRRVKKVNDLTDQINDLLNEIDIAIKRRQIVLNAIKRNKGMAKEDK